MQAIRNKDLYAIGHSFDAIKAVLNYMRESGGMARVTAAATAIQQYRFVGLNTSGALAVSPVSTERWFGVSDEFIGASRVGRVRIGGRAEVMPSASIAAANELVCEPGGFAAPFQAADISLGTAVAGADANDDIDQTNLPDQVSVICGGDETGNTVVIYGKVGSTYTKETVTLGTAATYTSTATFAAVYCLQTTAAATGTIDIKDATLTGLLIPQIAATTAARMYGAITPDVATDSKGHQVRVAAGGANTSECVVWGTDYAGAEQAEIVTMAGTTDVETTNAYRSFARMFIGADGIAWNAGATSQYEMDVEKDEKRQVRALALEAETTAGRTVECHLLPQNQGVVQGETPAIFATAKYSGNPGGTTATVTVKGVLATDIIQTTMTARTNAVTLDMATRSAADTITLTWSADPGASTGVDITVLRP